MAELIASNVSDAVVDEIRRRALVRGVSPEVEAGAVLSQAIATLEPKELSFKEHLLAMPDVGEDWMFDRKDPRNRRPEKPPVSFED